MCYAPEIMGALPPYFNNNIPLDTFLFSIIYVLFFNGLPLYKIMSRQEYKLLPGTNGNEYL